MANVRYKDHTLLTGGIAAGDVFPMDELISGSTYQTRRATGAMLQAWALAGVGAAAISNDYNDLDNLPTLFDGAFSSLSGKPTTLAGYGITDGVPNTRTVNGYPLSANVTITPTDLGLVIGTNVQAFDADLSAIGALTPADDDILQRKGGVWVNRTVAQVKTDFNYAAVASSGSASDLGAGTLPDARFPSTLPAVSGVNLTALNASNIASGSLNDARLSANVVLIDGSRSFTGVVAGVSPVGSSDLATKGYVDGLLLGLLDDRGNYDASINTFPASGGSGSGGAILKGDIWTISVAGTLGGHPVTAGDAVRALVDTPGQTDGNWAISENNFGYTPLNASLADGAIYIGSGAGIGTARVLSGDVTVNNTGVMAIGAAKVTNAMLAGSIAYGKLSLTGAILNADLAGSIDLATKVTGVLPIANGGTGLSALGTALQVLRVNAGGTALEYAAASGGGITVGTTTITSGTNTRVLYNNAGVVGEYTVTGSGNAVLSASPTLTGTVAAAAATFSDTIAQSSASATAFASGASSATPSFLVVNSVASQASGISVTGRADGTAPTIATRNRTQTTGALAGNGLAITADPAIAGSSTVGAAAGGSITITAGDAARLTSGNANGGDITLTGGTPVGTGTYGSIWIRKPNVAGQDAWAPLKMRATVNESTSRFISFYSSNDTTEQGYIASNAGNTGLLIQLTKLVTGSGTDGLIQANYTSTGGLYDLNNALALGSAKVFGWTSAEPYQTQDLVFRRLAAASLVQGKANNATPVANLFTIGESSRGGTDSNVAGANGTVQSGLGTGTGSLSTLILRSPIAAASGTTAQTYATGLTVIGGTAKMTSYTVAALPAAATVGAGARAFVTDALTPVFGSAVTGGGAVGVPVYSDGSTWAVG